MRSGLCLIGFLIAAVSFTSCASDSATSGGSSGAGPFPSGRGFLASSIDVDDALRARSGDGVSVGLPEESRVVSACVILYDIPVRWQDKPKIVSLARFSDIDYNGGDWTWTYESVEDVMPDDNVYFNFDISGDEFAPKISFGWGNLPVARYDLVVMLNPKGDKANQMLEYLVEESDPSLRNYYELLADVNGSYKIVNGEYPNGDYGVRFFNEATKNDYMSNSNYAFAGEVETTIANAFCGGITSPFVNVGAGSAPGNYTTATDLQENLKFFMMNADGIVRISASDFYDTDEKAASNPVKVNVERAVAKVAVFNDTGMSLTRLDSWQGGQDDFYVLPNGAKIWKNVYWTCDVISMFELLMRYPSNVAPATPPLYMNGNMGETPQTPRKYRYALPLYSEKSWQRQRMQGYDPYGEPPAVYYMTQFFRPSADIIEEGRWWNDMAASAEQDQWVTWEYVPENAVSNNYAFGDVTTSVMLMGYYIPQDDDYIVNSELPDTHRDKSASASDQEIIPGVEANSYFMFNGTALAQDVVKRLYDLYYGMAADAEGGPMSAVGVPVGQFPVLNGLETAFEMIGQKYADWYKQIHGADPDGDMKKAEHVFADWFCNRDAGGPVACAGLNYYSRCLHVYPVPIPHFGAELSPEFSGYGKHGVVRNNVYKLSVKSINGPGKPAYMTYEGWADNSMGYDLETLFTVEDWVALPLNFDM